MTFLHILLASVVCAGPQDASSAAAISAAEAEALIGALARKTAALEGFVARYRTEVEGEALELELAFAAPGRARLHIRGPGLNAESWVFADRMVIQGDFGDGPIRADFDPAQVMEFGDAYDRALREAFPVAAESSEELGAGPVLALDVVADSSRPEGHSLNAQLLWQARRRHVLSWMSRPEDWAGARREGNRLLRDEVKGAVIGLSLESGFVDEIRLKESLRLVELRTDEGPTDSTFVIPPAPAGVRDRTAEFSRQHGQSAAAFQRTRVYRLAVKSAAAATDEAASRARVRPVFAALHDVVQQRGFAAQIEKTEAGIEEFLRRWKERYAGTANDPAARKELDDAAAQWRAKLESTLADARETVLKKFATPPGIEADAAVLASIAAAEKDSLGDSHARTLRDPLLRRFDDGLRAAAGG